ncbi:MAG: sulfatase [Candidatus Altiarchaeota archaeon]
MHSKPDFLGITALTLFIIIVSAVTYGVLRSPAPIEGPATTLGGAPDIASSSYPGYNLIFISIETLRPDHMGCYGYDRDTTPFVDSVAGGGILFENMFTSRGLTEPSLTSMLTSLYPVSTNVRENGQVLGEGIPSIADVLRGEGYATIAVMSTGCHILEYGFGDKACTRYADDRNVDKTIKFLRKNKDGKFFLFTHLFAPHRPYKPPKKYDVFGNYSPGDKLRPTQITTQMINLTAAQLDYHISKYDGDVLWADSSVREIFGELESLGLLNKSIVFIFADHGEELYQHDYYFFHQCSIHDSVLHIPLIIRLPDGRYGGLRVGEVVENIDVVPTALELLGLRPLPHFEGKSMAPLFEPGYSGRDFGIALSELTDIKSIRAGRWRYIYNPEGLRPKCIPLAHHVSFDVEELYDHARDPLEQSNAASRYLEVSSRLRDKMLELYPVENTSREPIMADEKTLQILRDMGYVV